MTLAWLLFTASINRSFLDLCRFGSPAAQIHITYLHHTNSQYTVNDLPRQLGSYTFPRRYGFEEQSVLSFLTEIL